MQTRHPSASRAIKLTALLFSGLAATALAQTSIPKLPYSPPSSVAAPGSAGQQAVTHLQILASSANFAASPQAKGAPFPGYLFQTPASIACVYQLEFTFGGCNPNVVNVNPSGGGKAIAIVDAYDDPNAFADLQTFSSQFGLKSVTPSSFQVVFAPAGGSAPGSCTGPATRPASALGTGWDVEESLDIEWAHAMAPRAAIYLVEAQSQADLDLFCAVTVASKLVQSMGGGEVSMSWGSGEFIGENTVDPLFTTPNVVYFASTGDAPGVSYPSVSPNVVAVGGTSLSFNTNSGNFIGENTWQEAGGGSSALEPRPGYQNVVAHIVGANRGVPDVAADANPNTGVWVWDSLSAPAGWYIVGGTSVGSPMWAGIVNAAGDFAPSSSAALAKLYSSGLFSNLNDITAGDCGPYMGLSSGFGWDFCTGLGSPGGR